MPMRYQYRTDRSLDSSTRAFEGLLSYGRGMINRGMRYGGRALDRAESLSKVSPQQWADQAATDVRSAAGRAHAGLSRDLTRMGVNPNSGRFAGMRGKLALQGAAAEAGAANRARMAGQQAGFQNQMALAGAGAQLSGAGLSAVGHGAGGLAQTAGHYGAIAGEAAYDEATAPLVDMIDALIHDAPVFEELP